MKGLSGPRDRECKARKPRPTSQIEPDLAIPGGVIEQLKRVGDMSAPDFVEAARGDQILAQILFSQQSYETVEFLQRRLVAQLRQPELEMRGDDGLVADT